MGPLEINTIAIKELFRNLQINEELNISKQFTVLTGNNGSGKSNLLEYIYINRRIIGVYDTYISYLKTDDFFKLTSHESYLIKPATTQENTYLHNILGEIEKYEKKYGKDINKYMAGESTVVAVMFSKYLNVSGSENLSDQEKIMQFLGSGHGLASQNNFNDSKFKELCLSYYSTQGKVSIGKSIDEANKELKEIYSSSSAPWVILNKRLSTLGFNHELIEPTNFSNYDLKFRTHNRQIISFNDLSTGEKIIVHMTGSTLTANGSPIKFLLLDEPDCYLNPVMAKMLVDVLSDIAKNGTKIILSTHSPSTIALISNECTNFCWLENGKINNHEQKIDMIRKLTPNIFVVDENDTEILLQIAKANEETIVITEGKFDVIHYENAFSKLYPELVDKFHFIAASSAGALRSFIENIPEQFSMAIKIIAIFDYDHEGFKNYNKLTKWKCHVNYKSKKNLYAITIQTNFDDDDFRSFYCPVEILYDRKLLEENGVIETVAVNRLYSCVTDVDAFKAKFATNYDGVCIILDHNKSNFANNVGSFGIEHLQLFTGTLSLLETIHEIPNI